MALHGAAICGNMQEVRRLLGGGGVDVDIRDDCGRTSLHCAASSKADFAPALARLLLGNGADVNARDSDRMTPLHCAASSRASHAPALLKMVLAKGADVDAKDVEESTPLHHAAGSHCEHAPKIVKMLLDEGADVNAMGYSGGSPLHWASRRAGEQSLHVVSALLAKGADVQGVDEERRTPLHYTCKSTSEHASTLIPTLLLAGADVEAKDLLGRTPLHYAAGSTCQWATELVRVLLDQGAYVNARSSDGDTPLHHAARSATNHANDVVTALIAQGADAEAKNDYGDKPVDLAPKQVVIWVPMNPTQSPARSSQGSSTPVSSAVIGIRDDALLLVTARLREQAGRGKALLSQLCTSQCRLKKAMFALQQDPCTPGGEAERDTAFQLQAECARALVDFLGAGTDDAAFQEQVLQHTQQRAAEFDDTPFDTEDEHHEQQVDRVLDAASAARRTACDAFEAYATCTERMATAVRTATTIDNMNEVVGAMRAAAHEVVAAEGRLQGCRDRATVAGSALLATLASVRGKRALCESILQEAEKRPDKAGLVQSMQRQRDSLHEAQDRLDDTCHAHRKAKRRGDDTARLDECIAEGRRQVHKRQRILEKNEQDIAEAALRYYPELDLGQEVREWVGLCKRTYNNYTGREPLPATRGTHTVEKATRGDGTPCVLKHFNPGHSGRLLQEARVLQRLCHPCVAEVTCVFQTTDPVGWVMEMPYYSGGDLAQHMQRIRQEGMAAVCRIVLDVAQGLAFVHRNGVVHCDVKPANVFLEEDGRARLGDFDISKDVDMRAAAEATVTPTATHAAQRAPGYMAPEVEAGGKASFASDVYSLGLVLYDMVVPAGHVRPVHVPLPPGQGTPPPPVHGVLQAPALEALLVRMLCEDPAGRPTAEEVVLDHFIRSVHHSSLSLQLIPPVHWRDPGALGELVDVTSELRSVIQSQVNRTCTVRALGQGRFSKGTDHKGLRVEKVLRVEHAWLWQEYQFRRDQMQQHAQQDGVAVKPLCALSEGLDTDPLSQQLNEVRLFHGTKREYAGMVVSQGMDDRVCAWGLHGAGLYFAENSSKSDEYMVPAAEDGLCDLLVCRVLLGRPSVQTRPPSRKTHALRRPPCVEGHHPCPAGHRMADSIVAELPGRPREFVLFDRTRVFPEYVVRVRRVAVENPQCTS